MKTVAALRSAELEEFGAVVASICASRLEGVVPEIERSGLLPPSVMDTLASNELIGLGFATELGGSGDAAALWTVVYELAKVLPSAALLVTDAMVVGDALAGCPAEVRERVAAVLLGGGLGSVVDLPGHNGGSAIDDPATSVDGGVSCPRVHNGREAKVAVVVAGERVVVLAPEMWSLRQIEDSAPSVGLRGAPPCSVSVGPHQLESGAASTALATALRSRRGLLLATASIGAAGRAIDYAVEYTKSREQFGRRLSSIGWVSDTLDHHTNELASARDLLAAATVAFDGIPAGHIAARVRQTTDVAVAATLDAVQLLGGYGYLCEYPVERHLRDTLTLRSLTSAPVSQRATQGAAPR